MAILGIRKLPGGWRTRPPARKPRCCGSPGRSVLMSYRCWSPPTEPSTIALDGRRLRPNILIGGVEGLAERDWPGKVIAVGDTRIQAAQLRQRCVMTTYDPDTLAQDRSVLVRIVRELEGTIALDCSVLVPGTIRVGDAVEVLASSAAPASGW